MEIKANIEEAVKMLKSGGNVIKTRDDRELILVNSSCEIQNIDGCDWGLNNDEKVTNAIFRKRIEPWLTSLFQSEHLSLLCGSGITNAISRIAGAGGGTTMDNTSFSIYKR